MSCQSEDHETIRGSLGALTHHSGTRKTAIPREAPIPRDIAG